MLIIFKAAHLQDSELSIIVWLLVLRHLRSLTRHLIIHHILLKWRWLVVILLSEAASWKIHLSWCRHLRSHFEDWLSLPWGKHHWLPHHLRSGVISWLLAECLEWLHEQAWRRLHVGKLIQRSWEKLRTILLVIPWSHVWAKGVRSWILVLIRIAGEHWLWRRT